MPEILLRDEANRLDNPSLQRGVIETIIDKGARQLILDFPFDSFSGQSYDFNIEASLPDEDSAEDPYGEDIATGVGEPERIALDVGMLARDADTPVVNDKGKSTLNPQRARDIGSATKKMAKDWVRHCVDGTDLGVSLQGLEYWLQRYAGKHRQDGSLDHDDSEAPHFENQKSFGTDDEEITGTPVDLNEEMLRHFLNTSGDESYQKLMVDEKTYVAIQMIHSGMPGNTADYILDENLGRPVLTFDGVEVHKLEAAGAEKVGKNPDVDVTNDEITVSASGHRKFIGFSDKDVGREFTLTDGTNTYSGTVEDVIDRRNVGVSWDSAPGADLEEADGYTLTLKRTNVIYGIRHDTLDGVCAYYHETDGMPANPGEQYRGPIAGFNVIDMGRLQVGRRAYRAQIEWFGNFAVKGPRALGRLSHFSLA